MYDVAARLDPDSYYRLARATYAEMALAGITCVGEFHYLHHTLDGTPYDDPNAMGNALLAAARDAGIRITLLDALYLTSTVDGQPLVGPQIRFGDGSIDAWAARVEALKPATGARIGVAAHSVRAVPADALAELPTDRPAARPPLRTARRERRLPRPVRLLPDRAAAQSRFAGRADHRDPRHSSVRCGPHAPR